MFCTGTEKRASSIMLKAVFVLCLQLLQSATNRQSWATYFTTLVRTAVAIGVGLPFGGARRQNRRERWFVLLSSPCCHFP